MTRTADGKGLEQLDRESRQMHILAMPLQGFPRISVDSAICGGRPTISGTRVRVSDVLDMLAAGASEDAILVDFPYISAEDIRAVLAYAARGVLAGLDSPP